MTKILVMTSKSRVKGFGFEREIVNQFKEAGFDAKRAFGSNGKTLGEAEDVDVIVSRPADKVNNTVNTKLFFKPLRIQTKRRKKFPKSLIGLSDTVDASIIRADQEESFIIMRLEDFINLL